jgi:hypothetical protein
MKSIALVMFVVLASAGCAVKNIPLAPETLPTLQGLQVGQTRYAKPQFEAMTAGKAMFGVVGAVAMLNAGNKLVAEHRIQDPAPEISEALAKSLIAQLKLRPVQLNGAELTSDSLEDVVKTSKPVELLLDVKTIRWGFLYFPTDFSHYRLLYSFRVRLIDAKAGKVLAEGWCVQPDETSNPPTYDEMLANSAAWLKKELSAAAGRCTERFRKETLSL